ncbi:MAG TPA: DUF86 domain-containing protein [Chromatiales bacterium]|nr:DUF86 domain-containing protein [Chromatiales bacterium]
MPNPDIVLLGHMLEAVSRVEAYVNGVPEQEFWRDTEKQDAVLRQLQVLGEAARKVSSALRDAHPEVPWHKIAGMRNKVVHEYFVVDLEVVWETALVDIPAIGPALERIHGELQ